MPIIKSAIKRAGQSEVRRKRLLPVRTYMKTMTRKVMDLSAAKNKADAVKALQEAYKAIDTAAKKNLIHPSNASRRKSRLARAIAAVK